MKLNFNRYKDSVNACWIGKNIGGTMGGPYEGHKGTLDVRGFSTPENVVLPNDDLDLQLVWLRAVENLGARGVNATTLGEYWLAFVTPYWCEYGRGKTNMHMGLLPPLSGDAFNSWKNSNGSWIRSEIWACLAPGVPDVAVRYAREDAGVDHGAGEGTLAAMFTAALESAAFVVKDVKQLIRIALAKIPEESRVAKSVRLVMECHEKGMDHMETRNRVFEMNADLGKGWFEAPSNVAYAIIGLLWGNGDFKKSMTITINCGDDTDCTAGLVGAVLGILGGTESIPQDWKKHIGDAIETVAIARGTLYGIPESCTELTERVCKAVPHFLYDTQAGVELTMEADEIPAGIVESWEARPDFIDWEDRIYPNSYRIDFNYATAVVMLPGDPTIAPGETLRVKIRFLNHVAKYGNIQDFLKLRFLADKGFSIKGPKTLLISRRSVFDTDFFHDQPYVDGEFEITAGEEVEPINRVVIEVTSDKRITTGYIPITLLGK
ncbi:MAG: ADP-ribosylglycohydrolase family protein [Clostridia bacterium]|nr:ADP-ribosylglycohydrolase family protein [Clostridia bacterium]